MTQIRSKIHTYGNEKESSWPSEFGTGEKGVFHIDRHSGKTSFGYPVDENPKFGIPPSVIFDSMPPEYHPDAGRVIESRSEWEREDEKHNRLCFSTTEEPSRHTKKGRLEEESLLKKDKRSASIAALQAYRSNPNEVKQKLEKRAEEQAAALKKAGLAKQLKEAIKEKR